MTSLNKQDQHRITFIPIFAYCTLQCALSRGKWQRRVWKGRAARKARGIDKILSKNCWERRLTSGRPSLALFSLSFRSLLSLSLSLSLSLFLSSLFSLFDTSTTRARAFPFPRFLPSLVFSLSSFASLPLAHDESRLFFPLSLCFSLSLLFGTHTCRSSLSPRI